MKGHLIKQRMCVAKLLCDAVGDERKTASVWFSLKIPRRPVTGTLKTVGVISMRLFLNVLRRPITGPLKKSCECHLSNCLDKTKHRFIETVSTDGGIRVWEDCWMHSAARACFANFEKTNHRSIEISFVG